MDRLRGVLAWIVVVLLVIPVGGALYLGVAQGESPCILCWAQRTSMVLIALVALFVVRYGPKPRYLGMVVLLGAWGVFMAFRHSALHLARDVGQGFAGAILGAHTYVWAMIIHWIVLLVVGVLLLLLRGAVSSEPAAPAPPGRVGRFAMALLVVLVAANAVQAFISTGPPPFIGQADPVRLSLDPSRWVWMNDELKGPVSWRGAWTIPQPDATSADPDPARGPLAALPVLPVQRWERIGAALEGTLTDFAVRPQVAPVADTLDAAAAAAAPARALAVTDDFRVYVLDATFARVLHWVQLDPFFSIHLTTLAGAAFLDGDTLAVLSNNKSWVLLRPDSQADAKREWRHFLQGSSDVSELRRSRFATARARQQYVLSLAYDPAADELVTVSVPSPRHPRLVVSRFDRRDMLLSSEFLPELGGTLAFAGGERTLAEYVVTGATVVDGLLYAISAAHSTLLVIDLETKRLAAAYAVPGLEHPVGLASRGGELLVAQADGRIAVIARPGRS